MPSTTVDGGVSGTVKTPIFFDPRPDKSGIDVYLGKKKDGKPVLTIAAPESSRLAVTVSDDPRVDLVNAVLDPSVVLEEGTTVTDTDGGETPFGMIRSWKKKDGRLYVWDGGREISLPTADPSTLTPRGVPEVWGADGMLFGMAAAMKHGMHSLLSGPTGTAKTTGYRFLAELLGWDFILMPISRGTEAGHLIGEYLPGATAGEFIWVDGPVTQAVRNSQKRPTLLVFDELNRIGNIAEFARVYSLLDDSRVLELPERRDDSGTVERVHAGQLYIGATINPADSEDEGAATYVGVQELDPAFLSRFGVHPPVKYPPIDVESKALASRVPGLDLGDAKMMVSVVTKIREAADIAFDVSMRELIAWGKLREDYDNLGAARVALVSKAHPEYRAAIQNIINITFGETG